MRTEAVRQHAAQLANLYMYHRPVIQRCLNIGFVLYSLSSTYRSLSARSSRPKDKYKDKGKARDDGTALTKKSPRVAVCSGSLCWF